MSRSIFIYEIPGVSSVTPLDIHANLRGLSTTPDISQVDSTSANEIALGAAICVSTCWAGTGFTGLSDGDGNETEFTIVTVTGAQHTPFYQTSANWADSMVTFTDIGSIAQTSISNTFVAPQNIDADIHSKGPNPNVDITRYNARATATNVAPMIPGITASISSGQFTATLSSASTFQNGDGVNIFGAGAAHSMTPPSAPTVMPSIAGAGTGTGIVMNGPTGATTYNYQIVAVNKSGGLTAASAVGTTTTGAASLGARSVSITSISKSGQTNTVLTASAHGLTVGSNVNIVGTSDNQGFGGWFIVATVPDNTHFTYLNGMDSTSGAGTSATGGTVYWWNCNHLSWTAVTGANEYYIYGRTGGSLTLLGVSLPFNSGIMNAGLFWDDFGSPMIDNFTAPYFVPTAPPGAATSNNLSTTIASGAGTTTLTLAASAGTTVSGATILFDNAPNIIAAATAAVANGGMLYIPAASNFYVTNSYLVMPNAVSVSQIGSLVVNDTIEWHGGRWQGNLTPGSNLNGPAFSQEGYSTVNAQRANPGIYAPNNSGPIRGLQFIGLNSILVDTPNGSVFENLNFGGQAGNPANDYMSMGLHLRLQSVGDITFTTIRNVTFSGGPNQANGLSATPTFYCERCGKTWMENISVNRRGLFFWPANYGPVVSIQNSRYQGGITPYLTYYSSQNTGFGLTLHDVELDTTGNATFANLGILGSPIFISQIGTPTSQFGNITGKPLLNGIVAGPNGNTTGQNFAVSILGTGNFTNNTVQVNGTNGALGYAFPTPTAPSVVAGGAGSCSSSCVASGTHNYAWVAMDISGKASPVSPSTSVTVDGTQTVTVTITALPGQFQFNPERDTFFAFSTGPSGSGLTGTHYVDSAAGPSGAYNNSGFNLGLGTSASVGSQGLTGQQLILTNNGFKATFNTPLNGNVTSNLGASTMLTSTYTNATTTASNITELSFPVAANTNYTMACHLYYQGSVGTAGLDITIAGPASPTSVFYSYDEDATATALQDRVANAFGTKLVGNAAVTATTNLHATVTMGLRNGANTGAVQVQGSATGAGTVTVQAGSFCRLQ